jgi:plastocyanin
MRGKIALAVLVVVLLSGCMAAGGSTRVDAGDSYFEVTGQAATRNGETTASVGDSYRFTNVGAIDHPVTVHRPPDAADEFLIDEVFAPGDSVDFTFDEPGTYHVYCRFHGTFTSGMRLTVVAP